MQISLKFVENSRIDNKSVVVQVMAWHQTGNKPSLEPLLIKQYEAMWCHMALMFYTLYNIVEPLYNTIVFHQNTHKRHPIARP